MNALDLIPLVIAGLVAHLGLAMYCAFTRTNVLYVLATALLVMMPFSLALELPVPPTLLKFGRLYVQLLIIGVGVMHYRAFLSGPMSVMVWILALLYVLAALYSEYPLGGMLFKGLFLLTLTSGMIVTGVAYERREMDKLVNTLALGSTFFAGVCVMYMATHPGTLSLGRLVIWGINANFIGQAAAVFIIIAVWALVHDQRRSLMFFVNVGTIAALATVLLLAGSRGAMGMAILACAAAFAPYMRHPGRFIAMAGCVVVLIFAIDFFVTGEIAAEAETGRLTEINVDTRVGIWRWGMNEWRESPIYGLGFSDNPGAGGGTLRRSQTNHHSMYIQILVETGIIGAFFFLIALILAGMRTANLGLRWWMATGSLAGILPVIGILGGILGHGIGEAGTIMGSSANSFLLGLSVVMLDYMGRDLDAGLNTADEMSHEDPDGSWDEPSLHAASAS